MIILYNIILILYKMTDSNYSRIYNNGYLERNNFQGPPGIKGEKGDVGDLGQQGLRGVMGPIGPPGSIGPRGPRGLNGEQGFQGIKGDNGDRGKEGRIGLKGEIGNKGEIGDTGSTGCQGPKGEIGSQGLTGPTGLHGPYGERGPPGIQGEQGIQGLRGIEGSTGPKGDDGIPGIPGPDGSKGEIGPEGKLGHIGNTGPTGTSIVGVSGTTGGILFKDSNDNNYEISWPNFSSNTNNNNNNNNNNNKNVFQGLGSLSTIVGNSYYKLSNNKNPSSVEFCINSINIIPGNNSEYEIIINKNSSTDIGTIYSDHSDYFRYIREGMSILLNGHTTDTNPLNNKNLNQTAEFIITQILLDKLESNEFITIYASNIKFETNAATPQLVNNAWYKISIGYLPENGKIGPSGSDGINGSTGPTGNTGGPGHTGPTGSSIIKKNQVTNIESGCWYRFANTNLNKVLNTFYIISKNTKIILNATINKLLNEDEVSINILGNISDSDSIEAIRLLYSGDNSNSYLEYFTKQNTDNISQENYSIILDSFDNTSHNWNIQDPVRQFLDENNRGNKDLLLQELQDLNYKIKIIDVNKKNIGITTTNSINSNSIDINNYKIIKLNNNIVSLSKSMFTQNYQFSLTLLERNSAIKFNCRGNYTYNEILNSDRLPPSNSTYSLGSFSPIDPLELNANKDINQLNIASNFTQDSNIQYKDSFICPPYNNPIFQLYKREERSGGSALFTVQRYKENFNYYYQDDIIPEIYRNSYSKNIPQGICFSGNLGIIKNISLNLINDNIYKNINDSPGTIMISDNDVVIQNIQNVLYDVPGYISFRIEIHKYEGINPYINNTRIQYTNWITSSKYQYYIDISKNDWNFENNINTQNYTKGYVNYGDIISIIYKFVITGKTQSGEIRNQLQEQSSNKIKYYPYTIDIQSLKFGVDIQNIEIFN